MSKEQTGVVEDHSHDKVFVVTFLGVLAILVGIAIVIAIIANAIDEGEELSPVTVEKIQQRLTPVGEVYTDASQIPAKPMAAADTSRSTDEIVQSVCASCHTTGLLNAPKVGDKADWDARLKATGGLDGLVASAIAGKGTMPPRGGDASLTDEQIRAAVKALLE